ncbi:hypothetical protein GCM10011379_06640 [Filimonas zeae]|uniref:Uncharacterized protein n=2 Tax=Filimonas zeae TaxID=1737353 RepID=A0A917IQM6_9BACT|nr:hypothetical protein GCM10011379_06640 [Filimonas zeae]
MITEPPFSTAKKLIDSGHIQNIKDLLDTVPKTRLARAMKTAPERFNKLIENPPLFTFEDAYKIADLIGVDERTLVLIIHEEKVRQQQFKEKAQKTKTKK